MTIKLFTQPGCPKCPAAKELMKKLRIANCELRIEEFDVSTFDGLAEASFYTVMSTPGLVLCNDKGEEIKGWRGETPNEKEILSFLKEKNAK